MSILIQGMKMPTGDNNITLFLYPDGKAVVCGMLGPLDHYEAVELPPHGRLIDVEPILKFIQDGLNNGEFGNDVIQVMTEIQYAPAVIPASTADKEGDG